MTWVFEHPRAPRLRLVAPPFQIRASDGEPHTDGTVVRYLRFCRASGYGRWWQVLGRWQLVSDAWGYGVQTVMGMRGVCCCPSLLVVV
ncbi:hypothetical protein V6Z11_A05G244100 [Gossypium hirsutum]